MTKVTKFCEPKIAKIKKEIKKNLEIFTLWILDFDFNTAGNWPKLHCFDYIFFPILGKFVGQTFPSHMALFKI